MIKGSKHSKKTIDLIKKRVQYALSTGLMGKKRDQETKDKIRESITIWWKKRKSLEKRISNKQNSN